MKASTSKKLTAPKYMAHFLSASVLFLTFSVAAQAQEIGSGNQQYYTPEQALQNRCYSVQGELATAKTDFVRACSKAGLGSTAQSCMNTLDDCSGSEADQNPKCLNHATSTKEIDRLEEKEDKIRDRINELLADKEEERLKQVEIAAEKEDADAKLEATLIEISNGQANALTKAISKQKSITESIAQQYTELEKIQLGLRKFVLDNEMKCRESAEKYKAAYVSSRREQAANGNQSHLTQGQLFNRAGLSVNQMGAIKYNRYLRNCTSLFTKNGKVTGFGSAYRFRQKEISLQRQTVQRSIRNLISSRVDVENERKSLISQLGQQKNAALAAHTRELRKLQNKAIASTEKMSRLESSLLSQQLRLQKSNGQTGSAMNVLLASLGRSSQQDTAPSRAIASQSKIDAFDDANSLRVKVESLEDNAGDCGDTASAIGTTLPPISVTATAAPATVSN